VPDYGKPGVNRRRRLSTGKRNSELAAFSKGLVRLVENEVGSVGNEILGSD
jgi:hypothetical protein